MTNKHLALALIPILGASVLLWGQPYSSNIGVARCIKLVDEELPKVLSELRSTLVRLEIYKEAYSPVERRQNDNL